MSWTAPQKQQLIENEHGRLLLRAVYTVHHVTHYLAHGRKTHTFSAVDSYVMQDDRGHRHCEVRTTDSTVEHDVTG